MHNRIKFTKVGGTWFGILAGMYYPSTAETLGGLLADIGTMLAIAALIVWLVWTALGVF